MSLGILDKQTCLWPSRVLGRRLHPTLQEFIAHRVGLHNRPHWTSATACTLYEVLVTEGTACQTRSPAPGPTGSEEEAPSQEFPAKPCKKGGKACSRKLLTSDTCTAGLAAENAAQAKLDAPAQIMPASSLQTGWPARQVHLRRF